MRDKIQIQKINEVYLRVTGEPGIEQELADFFKFDTPNKKFMPQFRNRNWNGFIYLYSIRTKLIYAGLLDYIIIFCNERNIDIEYLYKEKENKVTEDDVNLILKYIKPTVTPRDYQLEAFTYCLKQNRALIVSPTGSGKSLAIYLISRTYTTPKNSKALIIVPTVSLVYQMSSDFVSYGYDEEKIHMISSGAEKHTDKPITVSTWQSLYKMPKKFFDQFSCVIVDECHLAKAKSIKDIMTKLVNCKYRFGFTGTLDNIHCHKLIIQGLTGPVKQTITTKELMDKKLLAQLEINIICLGYPEAIRKLVHKSSYQDEMDFLVRNDKRNNFISNLANNCKGNTLVLFQYVEKHGIQLFDKIKESGKDVYFIYSNVSGEERERIRKIVEKSDNAIIVASYGTLSTGVNIVNLHNIIMASPSKSKVRVLQSIGRELRISESKKHAKLFDICDDLTYKDKQNHTLKHMLERVKYYNEERFSYKTQSIELYR